MIKTTKPAQSESVQSDPVKSESGSVSRLLTIKNVADRLQVSERTVHRLIDARELDVIRIGRSLRISEQALKALLTRGDKP